METVTLRGEDFRTVHNTLCDLRSVQERLCGVVSNAVVDQLQNIIKGFEAGLKDAYEQDSSAFDRKMDHYSDIQSENKLRAIWSMFEVSDLRTPHPFTGATAVVYSDHWGPGPVRAPIEGALWVDLFRAADAAIRASGDDHHIFIEQLRPSGTDLVLQTGS